MVNGFNVLFDAKGGGQDLALVRALRRAQRGAGRDQRVLVHPADGDAHVTWPSRAAHTAPFHAVVRARAFATTAFSAIHMAHEHLATMLNPP